jgi:hypothetical protein
MCDGCPVHADVVFVAKLQEFPASKLGAVAGDDGIQHSEPVDDVGEEGHGLLCPEVCDWACLDPLGKFEPDWFTTNFAQLKPGHAKTWAC